MFEAFREFIKTIQEFIESSFETFKLEKQRTFRAINFKYLLAFFTGTVELF